MAYKLIVSKSFEEDVDEVLQYISYKLYSPNSANRLLDKTEETIIRIKENPFLYPKYHDPELAKKGYHYAIIANYLLFYSINETTETIHIARFLYGNRNIRENID